MVRPDRPPPERLGEYRLVRQLGRGGMGQVWLAIDELLDRPVALKLVDRLVPDSTQRRRFLIEARAIARLSHPNVVAIHRVGELDGVPYIVTEWVRGHSLDQLPRPMPGAQVLELGIGLARGLAAAHRAGVLHRDLKPANAILDDDGVVKLLDFGLAKLDDDGEPAAAWPVEAPAAPAPDPAGDVVATWAPAEDGHRTVSFVAPVGAPLAVGHPLSTLPSMVIPGVTRDGAVVGTPFYMSPETWRGEPPTRRSDLYSLGALLHELAAGSPAFADVERAALPRAVIDRDAPPLAGRVPGLDPRLAAIIDRCLARDPAARFDSAADLRDALEALAVPAAAARAIPAGNPYRGLARFEAEHAGVFFGRRADTTAVLDRLRAGRLVVIAGDSGVGKSSLARAGVMPAIAAGALGDGRRWRTATCMPGRRPRAAIAEALAEASGADVDAIAAALDDPTDALRVVRAAAGADGVAVLIDQLEELVTRADPEDAAVIARWLIAVADGAAPFRVLATARGDHVTRLASLPGLGEEVARALHVVAPLDDVALRAAIVGPAETTGVRFEPATLVDDLVAAGRADGGLPLLEFALAALWESRDAARGTITRDALDALGGVAGALSRHADGVIAALPAPTRAAARRVLLSLVAAEGTASGRTEAELSGAGDPEARAALDALIAGRLVVARVTPDGVIHDLAHERLATSWATLRGWLDEGVGHRAIRERLVRAAGEWHRLGGATAALWRDRRLDEARALPADELGPAERGFLRASARSRLRRRVALGLAILAVPAIALGGWEWSRREARAAIDRRVDVRIAEAHVLIARARENRDALEASRRAAWRLFDDGDREAGDAAWADVLVRAAALDGAWSRATQTVEAALLVDGARADARGLLGDVLLERALLAERDHRAADVDELLARLTLYDQHGSRAATWHRAGQLDVDVTPSGAELSFERFIDGRPSRWEAVARTAELPPGSYRIIGRAPGHADGILPVLLERGSDLRLALTLPRAGAVPPDFVYVPAGAYLAGVVADDGQRRDYFEAAPLHPTSTGAYLISRTETTWREWIAYLEALPPAERAARLPGSATVGAQGEVALRATSQGWELRIAPTGTVLTARAGQPLRYPDRRERAEQDWLELPVTGVSGIDARAYAAWRATRGLAGARMCREAEWERAARGADGRMFPGGRQLEPGDANYQETYGGSTAARGPDEVGSYPASNSPFGVQDLAGNVFELVAGASPEVQYVRGGGYGFAAIAARSEFRDQFEPAMRDVAIGVRICADVEL